MRVDTQFLQSDFVAEILDLDTRTPPTAIEAAELRRLLGKHKVLVLRGQDLSNTGHVAFLGAFGPVRTECASGALYTMMTNVDPEAEFAGSVELGFHADFQFMEQGPLRVISLYGVDVANAEPTLFCDMSAAAAAMPAELRRRLAGLKAVQAMNFTRSYSEVGRCRLSERPTGAPDGAFPHHSRPVLDRHPVTGEIYLCVSQTMTSHIEGWSDAESDALFKEIEAYAYSPANTYCHQWRTGDLVIWDNVALQHARPALRAGSRRHLRRVFVHHLDFPTMLRGVTPDPERFSRDFGWWNDASVQV
ncbi:MAG: TauD/TfdA dioxygenase family protein [Gammaproteobacteria bacterium]